MIHVAYKLYGGDGHYAKYCGTSMLSMFENTKEKVTVHIMHNDSLTPENRGAFYYIAGQYNQKIEFHNVEQIAGASLKKIEEIWPSGKWPRGVWYTFIVHEVFPNLDKLIVIGTDTIINLDIAELWAYDLGEYGIGAVSEYLYKGNAGVNPICRDGYVSHENHFNSDVLLLKPNLFKANFENVIDACKFLYEKKYPFMDQDVLNYLFSEKYLHLPREFNAVMYILYHRPEGIGKSIYHYAVRKPSLDTNRIYNKLYLEYFLKTPWANADMFGKMDKAFNNQYDRIKFEFLRYVNILGDRGRVFLVNKSNQETMRQIFKIKAGELVIDISDADVRKNFLETVNELKGRFLIFVLHDLTVIRNELSKRNLVEGEDFCDATIFLTPQWGGRTLIYDSQAILNAI